MADILYTYDLTNDVVYTSNDGNTFTLSSTPLAAPLPIDRVVIKQAAAEGNGVYALTSGTGVISSLPPGGVVISSDLYTWTAVSLD